MPALLVQPADVAGDRLVLRGEEVHHLRVRRHQPGDTIDVIDGRGRYYRTRLEEVGKREAWGVVLASEEERGESALRLHLAAALVKGQRLDYAIEKATEVGVASIAPMSTARAVARPGSGGKLKRWQRLAQAATKQSGRSRVPAIAEVADFSAVLENLGGRCDAVLMGEPRGGRPLADLELPASGSLGLLVGPEGGFSPEEVTQAGAAGVIPFTWGCSTLRSDTAAVVLSALVLERVDGARPDPAPSARNPEE